MLADAISFFASALLILSIKARDVRERVHAPRESLRHELREGVRFLAGNPYMRAGVVSAGIINFAYGIIWAVLLLFAVRTLHLGAAVIGGVLAIGEFGGVVGALVAKPIARVIGVGWTMIGATMLVGPAWLLLGFATRGTAVPVLAAGWALSSFAAVITAVDRYERSPVARAAALDGSRRRDEPRRDLGCRPARIARRRRARHGVRRPCGRH